MARKTSVGIRQLKNEISRIVEEVRERGSKYVVTKRGEPVAVIRPWEPEDEREERRGRAREVMARLAALADQVAQAAEKAETDVGAVAAVSEQRR